jgi:phospholipase/lecithinase/hemolysin
VPFLIVKHDWRKTNTLSTPTISPKTSNKNFEMAVLFNAAEKSGNYVFEDDTHPTTLSTRVVSYALGAYNVL